MDLKALEALSDPCRLCARDCNVSRKEGELGYCGVGCEAVISQVGLHFGEEDCLVAGAGSGTVFFSGCNLLCIFCQNSTISHMKEGGRATVEQLAKAFLMLQAQGAANVNFVTPTHFTHVIARAVMLARESGLAVPTVYNCGGFEKVETLQTIDGLVDVYMPDLKTLNGEFAGAVLNAPEYPEVVRDAFREMHRQVGDLVIERGRAVRGLLVRHLVMPGQSEDSRRCLEFLKDLSPNTGVNVMAQYRPCHHADRFPPINRRPAYDEISEAREYAASLGLRLL